MPREIALNNEGTISIRMDRWHFIIMVLVTAGGLAWGAVRVGYTTGEKTGVTETRIQKLEMDVTDIRTDVKKIAAKLGVQ